MTYQQRYAKLEDILESEEQTGKLGLLQHFDLIFNVLPVLKTRALFEKNMEDEEDINHPGDDDENKEPEHDPGVEEGDLDRDLEEEDEMPDDEIEDDNENI